MATIYGHSPHSSSGIYGSAEGTPDTRLTAFSPDDGRPSKSINDISGAVQSKGTQNDPFVTNTTTGPSRLSATAQPFAMSGPSSTPPAELTFTAAAALSGQRMKLDGIIKQFKSTQGPKNDDLSSSVGVQGAQQGDISHSGIFSTDTNATRCIQITTLYQADTSVSQLVIVALQMLKARYNLTGSERVEQGLSAVYLRYSHINDAAKVYSTLKAELPQFTVEYITPAAFASAVQSPTKGSYSAHEGQVVLTARYPIGTPYKKKVFEDGLRALISVEGSLYAWQRLGATEAGTFRMVAEFCDSALALHAVQRLNGKSIKLPQGDVVVSLGLHTPDLSQPSHHLGHMSSPTRRSGEQSDFDTVLGRMSLNRIQTPGFTVGADVLPISVPGSSVLPYMTTNVGVFGPSFEAQAPVSGLPLVMGGLYGSGQLKTPHGYPSGLHQQYAGGDFNPTVPSAGFNHSNARFGHHGFEQGHGNLTVALAGFNQHRYQQYGFQNQNYSYGSGYANTSSYDHHRDNTYFNRPSGHRQNAQRTARHLLRGRQFPSPPVAGHHNHVDIHRIRQGIDVRTTVMLRNIPNKVDQAMLKEIIDESSFGRYDFMYLRIDFSNDCNVGYAFINFTDPLDIIDFVVARSNQKWHRFKSDKVAEVSYATIQGRDCLIQKFRNSSVMLEPPHYRPKLFFTIHDPTSRAGEEDQFPASDNASKLKRSCENAENVGLFAPSAGQHLRDEQRRRRSQFDRGTSLAEREEYGFEDGSMPSGYRPPYYG